MENNTFKKLGYTVVRDKVSLELVNVLTQYALFDEMQDFNEDTSQVVGAHSKYADPAMESMLLYLHPLMEEYTGLSLAPTYSFYRVYRNGDELKPHKDRPSCEISATLCFNYSYDDSLYQWPIIIEENKINLYPGDFAIYRGVDLEHSREIFSPHDDNSWHVQAFLHYIDIDGPYLDYKFDKRNSIGEIESNKNKKKYIDYV